MNQGNNFSDDSKHSFDIATVANGFDELCIEMLDCPQPLDVPQHLLVQASRVHVAGLEDLKEIEHLLDSMASTGIGAKDPVYLGIREQAEDYIRRHAHLLEVDWVHNSGAVVELLREVSDDVYGAQSVSDVSAAQSVLQRFRA